MILAFALGYFIGWAINHPNKIKEWLQQAANKL